MTNIFENMSQSVHNQLCSDSEYLALLNQESEKIGSERINEAFPNDEWMSPEDFGEYLKNEIKCMYNSK